MMNPKNEIVGVARGYYALPILMALGKKGVLEKLLGEGTTLEELGGNSQHLGSVFTYLSNLGWIAQSGDRYQATELGSKVLRRSGAFGILYSYRNYIQNLDALLFDPQAQVDVHRADNVIGSGAAHERKYFSKVEAELSQTEAKWILDVGCGDGTFLDFCRRTRPDIGLIGVDFNERALDVTRQNLPDSAVLFQGNVAEPDIILHKLRQKGIDPSEVMVSVWFIFHEVLGFAGIDLTEILRGYRNICSNHGLLVGEIFDVPTDVLAHHHNESAVPEFNLFHDLSGQKLFSIQAWREHIKAAGFSESRFIGLDKLPMAEVEHFGSGIWALR